MGGRSKWLLFRQVAPSRSIMLLIAYANGHYSLTYEGVFLFTKSIRLNFHTESKVLFAIDAFRCKLMIGHKNDRC